MLPILAFRIQELSQGGLPAQTQVKLAETIGMLNTSGRKVPRRFRPGMCFSRALPLGSGNTCTSWPLSLAQNTMTRSTQPRKPSTTCTTTIPSTCGTD